jgi:putative endonuclease
MPESTKMVGDEGEDLAADFLLERGYAILERNYRQRFAEIDLIAIKDGVLAFCEVKSSHYPGESHPEIRVGYKKQIKLAQCAQAFLAANPPAYESCRFDVITVKLQQGRRIIDHIENAFWPPDGWDRD